jgi:DNA-directed RNA polymerase specialized sigma24 family protein
MSQTTAFQELIRRVEQREEAACTELVAQFQDELLRKIRIPLISLGLQRVLDPMDICQAVFASFFSRVVGHGYDLQEPRQLANLLATMAKNKVTDEARRYHTIRRNQARLATDAEDCLNRIPADVSTPSSIAVKQETLQLIYGKLREDERTLMEQRALGREWADLAAEYGSSPDGLRKKLDRALERALRDLGMA